VIHNIAEMEAAAALHD